MQPVADASATALFQSVTHFTMSRIFDAGEAGQQGLPAPTPRSRSSAWTPHGSGRATCMYPNGQPGHSIVGPGLAPIGVSNCLLVTRMADWVHRGFLDGGGLPGGS
jgi:hypothetical protein